MIQMGTILHVGDNSGAKLLKCIKVLGGAGKMVASTGDEIVVSVRDAIPSGKVKEGEVHRAVVVGVAKEVRQSDGSYLRFDRNVVVIINKQGEPIGSRILSPVSRELRAKGFIKIISLAPEVV